MGIELIIFLGLGCIIGIVAGLLGVGGGTIVVPTLVFFLQVSGAHPDIIMKVALGTSFATVAMTSISSALAHQRRKTVMWGVVFMLGFGTMVGVAIGGRVVSHLSDSLLQILFCIFLAYTIFNMLRNAEKVEADSVHNMPKIGYVAIGSVIGFLSSFVGIGGGVMIVPVLSKIGHKMKNAIATSSAVGVLLALSGAISAVFSGYNVSELPSHSIGFVYLPAFLGLSITSILFAPIGARLVYTLPVKRIRQIFAGFLTIVLTIFLYNNYIS